MTPERPERPVTQWAHQGGAKEAPSNTLRAMRHALAVADGRPLMALECDVHVTADGELAVIHDEALERTTNGRGRVAHQPYRPTGRGPGISAVHAAWWWHDDVVDDHHTGPWPLRDEPLTDDLRVPTVEQVLDLDRPGKLTIELKSKAAAQRLAELLAARGHRDEGLVVTSFATRHVRRFRTAMGDAVDHVELAPGLGYMVWFKFRVALGLPPRDSIYARIQIPVRILKMQWATPRFVRAAQGVRVRGRTADDGTPQRIAVDVWTIDDEATMEGLLDLQVDGIMTDRPTRLADVVGRRQGGG